MNQKNFPARRNARRMKALATILNRPVPGARKGDYVPKNGSARKEWAHNTMEREKQEIDTLRARIVFPEVARNVRTKKNRTGQGALQRT